MLGWCKIAQISTFWDKKRKQKHVFLTENISTIQNRRSRKTFWALSPNLHKRESVLEWSTWEYPSILMSTFLLKENNVHFIIHLRNQYNHSPKILFGCYNSFSIFTKLSFLYSYYYQYLIKIVNIQTKCDKQHIYKYIYAEMLKN